MADDRRLISESPCQSRKVVSSQKDEGKRLDGTPLKYWHVL